MNKWIVLTLSSGLLVGCNGFTPPPLPEVVVGSCTYLSNAVGYPGERHAMGDPPAIPLRFEL